MVSFFMSNYIAIDRFHILVVLEVLISDLFNEICILMMKKLPILDLGVSL